MSLGLYTATWLQGYLEHSGDLSSSCVASLASDNLASSASPTLCPPTPISSTAPSQLIAVVLSNMDTHTQVCRALLVDSGATHQCVRMRSMLPPFAWRSLVAARPSSVSQELVYLQFTINFIMTFNSRLWALLWKVWDQDRKKLVFLYPFVTY